VTLLGIELKSALAGILLTLGAIAVGWAVHVAVGP
jgi:hypothetical protein